MAGVVFVRVDTAGDDSTPKRRPILEQESATRYLQKAWPKSHFQRIDRQMTQKEIVRALLKSCRGLLIGRRESRQSVLVDGPVG